MSKTEFLILRVDKQFKAALLKLAKKSGTTISEFIRQALEDLCGKAK